MQISFKVQRQPDTYFALYIVAFAMLFLVTPRLFGQGAPENTAAQAEAIAKRAARFMDRDMGEAAIAEWKKALDLVPNHAPYMYENALAHVMTRRYEDALTILKPIYSRPELFDRGYQLMGNIHDFLADSSSAMTYYVAGLEAFPLSGRLHYEIGAANYIGRNVEVAVDWWRRGTRVEPMFSTNYYWVAKVMSAHADKIISVWYAEAFLNIERSTNRTKEISKLLFDTWNAAMAIGDTLDPINFCSDSLLDQPGHLGPSVQNLPTAFEYSVAMAAELYIPDNGSRKGPLSLEEMVSLRSRVARLWRDRGYDTLYNNSVMAWNASLVSSGQIREYLYWLFSFGDVKAMNEYFKKSEQRYDTFLAWFGQNMMSFSQPLCLEIRCP